MLWDVAKASSRPNLLVTWRACLRRSSSQQLGSLDEGGDSPLAGMMDREPGAIAGDGSGGSSRAVAMELTSLGNSPRAGTQVGSRL